jgi:hypothetical protein
MRKKIALEDHFYTELVKAIAGKGLAYLHVTATRPFNQGSRISSSTATRSSPIRTCPPALRTTRPWPSPIQAFSMSSSKLRNSNEN